MLSKQEHYSPLIEDFYIGYICEYELEGKWVRYIWGIESFSDPMITKVRTKYLTKEDIESLGWKFFYQADDTKNLLSFKSRKFLGVSASDDFYYYLVYNMKTKNIMIYRDFYGANEVSFSGKCLSINELNKIQQLTEIKPTR